MGTTVSTATATPLVLDMGGTYANGVGDPTKMKLKLYDDGASLFGLGVSGNAFELFTKAASTFVFYCSTTYIAEINATGTATSLTLRGANGGPAYITLQADNSDDNGDDWRLRSDHTTNNFMLQNDTSGSQITKLSLTTAGILGIDHIAELTGAHGIAMDNAVT
jgi:hypothetical protein